jgi:type VI secretion system protein ImpJ
MINAKRILWGEGQLVCPQHFQQLVLQIEGNDADVLQTVQRHHWGLRRLELDSDVLREGKILASRLEVTFRDGTRFDAFECEPLPQSRTLSEIPLVGTNTVLYACLPDLDPRGGNTAMAGEQTAWPARYRSAHHKIADLYTHALEEDISTLDLDVRLMVDEENRDGFDSVPIARLVKDATGKWKQDEEYLPPLADVSGSPALMGKIRRLLEIMQVKSGALASTHRERTKDIVGYGTADIGSFWMLHTINSRFATLNHLAKSEPLHPEELYLMMAGFCAELLTFSNAYSLSNLPEYCHEQLYETFTRLDELIRELLDTVISSRYKIIPLTQEKPSFYIGHLDSERLIENVDYYLSIQVLGEVPFSRVLEEVPTKFKVGAPDDVEKILHSAMRGVNLMYTQQPPTSLPVRVGNHYFAFDPRGEIFESMIKARSIRIYVPESLSSLKLELIAVFR